MIISASCYLRRCCSVGRMISPRSSGLCSIGLNETRRNKRATFFRRAHSCKRLPGPGTAADDTLFIAPGRHASDERDVNHTRRTVYTRTFTNHCHFIIGRWSMAGHHERCFLHDSLREKSLERFHTQDYTAHGVHVHIYHRGSSVHRIGMTVSSSVVFWLKLGADLPTQLNSTQPDLQLSWVELRRIAMWWAYDDVWQRTTV